MERLKKLLDMLKEKYIEPLSIEKLLYQKYSGSVEKCDSIEELKNEDIDYADKVEDKENVLFSQDEKNNKKVIERLLESFSKVEEYIDNLSENAERNIAVDKIILKYKKELEKIIEKEEYSDASKLADKYAKIIKKTLLKLWNKEYAKIIYAYFLENSIEMEAYETGHKMTDDEICMLDGDLIEAYKVRTDDSAKRYVVIEMIQPIIHISFIDDEEENEIEYKDICGVCSFYVS